MSAMRLRGWIVAGLALAGSACASAQNAPADEPVLAQDLHEQVLHLAVTVKDINGRQERR